MSAQHTTLIQASPEELAALVAAEVQRLGLSAEPVWVNADELASRLGVSKRQIELLAFHGKIPHIDLAMPGSERRMLRFSLQAVQRVIAGAAQEGNAQHDGAQTALVRPGKENYFECCPHSGLNRAVKVRKIGFEKIF